MIHIRHPAAPDHRWSWLFDVVLTQWLGIPFTREVSPDSFVSFHFEGAELFIENDFLLRSSNHAPTTELIPKLPLNRWVLPDELSENIEDAILPVMFGAPHFSKLGKVAKLSLDIFGTIFFVLSRYEEVASSHADQHDRFPGAEGIAHKDGHIQRPIVDEYVEVFWNALLSVMPQLRRKQSSGQISISCDVDEPYERWIKSPLNLAKGVAGALIRRRSLSVAARRIRNAWSSSKNDFTHDPNWCFDWYMKICETHGHLATFYFIPTSGLAGVDAAYSLNEARINDLIQSILERGHRIGMHASYGTYLDPILLMEERNRLEKMVKKINPNYTIEENRQHFLRWRVEATPDYLESAGFNYDASGGFADLVGFRFGTSREFQMWSWKKLDTLSLIQRPLIVMEGTIMNYMNIEMSTEGMDLIKTLAKRSKRYGGNFSLLWHNSSLGSEIDKSQFNDTLCALSLI
jgi:hypothetical protein